MRFRASDLFTVFIILVLAGAVIVASGWVLRASIIILVLGSIGVVLATAQLAVDVFMRREARPAPNLKFELPMFDAPEPGAALKGSLEIWAWLLGLLAAIPLFGLPLALPLFVLVYTRFYGASWWLAALLTALIGGFIVGIYNEIMHVYWPDSVLGNLLLED